MLIDVIRDEELQNTVKVFISSLLPHENYNADYFTQNLNILFSYIHLEETKLEYRLLLKVLSDLNKIRTSYVDYKPSLSKETFTAILETGIVEAVSDSTLGVKEWLAYEGLENNLQIESVKVEVCQKLAARSLELYDDCYDLAIDSADVINREPELRAAFIAHVGMQSINTQISIMQHSTKVGRRTLSGFQDWLKYTSEILSDIKSRLNLAEVGSSTTLDSTSKVITLFDKLKDFFIPIANYGIPPIDDFTPILRHRMVVIAGQENVGKTKFAIDKAVNVLLSGHKVVFMCGETQQSKMLSDIMINFIYKRYGIIIRAEHLVGREDPDICPDDVRKIISITIDDLVTGGLLTLCDAFRYDTLYEELTEMYEKTEFDVCIIDHSCALAGTTGDGSLKAKVDKLSSDVMAFRRAYPVCIMVTSHLSTTAKDSVSRDRSIETSPTKGSQNLSTDADDVFVLRDTETLRKQNLLFLENTKRRDASKVVQRIILQRFFAASSFIYDENQQELDDDVSASTEEVIKSLEYEDSDEYIL